MHDISTDIDQGRYPYTRQLLALERCRRSSPSQDDLPQDWCRRVTPMHLSFWEAELADHQDWEFASWVCKGIKQGFHIGFSDKNTVLHPSRFNMLSATDHPQIIREYITKELGAHHLLEVNQGSHNFKNIQISQALLG